MPTPRTLVVPVALALSAAACGDTTPNADQTVTTAGANGSSTTREVTITAENLAFDTTTLDATVGETLTITYDNRDDGIAHNLHVTGGTGGPVTTELEEGPVMQSLDVTFDDAGEFEFFCEVHPQQMSGTVTVSP